MFKQRHVDSNTTFLVFACNWGWALQGLSGAGHSRSLWNWALQGVSGVGRWALQGVFGVGQGVSGVWHLRKSLRLGTPGIFLGCSVSRFPARAGHSRARHCRDSRLGLSGTLWVGHY